jgi:hypothetical protein
MAGPGVAASFKSLAPIIPDNNMAKAMKDTAIANGKNDFCCFFIFSTSLVCR